jgi:hypothetical protein
MNIGEIQIRKGVPIPDPIGHIKSPITEAFRKMELEDCIDLPYGDSKFKSDIYMKAKTAKIKITLRSVNNNGMKIIRVWRIA